MIEIKTEAPIMLSIQGASQMTGGLMSERKIWQLVKEHQIDFTAEGGNIAIPLSEMQRLLGQDVRKAA
jgi:hypothetical protein